jgi:hypothetical protein
MENYAKTSYETPHNRYAKLIGVTLGFLVATQLVTISERAVVPDITARMIAKRNTEHTDGQLPKQDGLPYFYIAGKVFCSTASLDLVTAQASAILEVKPFDQTVTATQAASTAAAYFYNGGCSSFQELDKGTVHQPDCPPAQVRPENSGIFLVSCYAQVNVLTQIT